MLENSRVELLLVSASKEREAKDGKASEATDAVGQDFDTIFGEDVSFKPVQPVQTASTAPFRQIGQIVQEAMIDTPLWVQPGTDGELVGVLADSPTDKGVVLGEDACLVPLSAEDQGAHQGLVSPMVGFAAESETDGEQPNQSVDLRSVRDNAEPIGAGTPSEPIEGRELAESDSERPDDDLKSGADANAIFSSKPQFSDQSSMEFDVSDKRPNLDTAVADKPDSEGEPHSKRPDLTGHIEGVSKEAQRKEPASHLPEEDVRPSQAVAGLTTPTDRARLQTASDQGLTASAPIISTKSVSMKPDGDAKNETKSKPEGFAEASTIPAPKQSSSVHLSHQSYSETTSLSQADTGAGHDVAAKVPEGAANGARADATAPEPREILTDRQPRQDVVPALHGGSPNPTRVHGSIGVPNSETGPSGVAQKDMPGTPKGQETNLRETQTLPTEGKTDVDRSAAPVSGAVLPERSQRPQNSQAINLQDVEPLAERETTHIDFRGDARATESQQEIRGATNSSNPVSIARQISQQLVEVTRNQKDGLIDVTLKPEELGRIRISFSHADAGLSVFVVADRTETLDLLRRNIDVLAQELSDLGYEGTDFDFGSAEDQKQQVSGMKRGSAEESGDQGENWGGEASIQTLAHHQTDGLDIRI